MICFEPEAGGAPEDIPIAGQNGWLADLRSSGEFTGKLYESVTLYRPEGIPAKRLVVTGGGKSINFTPTEARRVAGVLVRSLKPKGVKTVALWLESTHATPANISAIAEGAVTGAWDPDKYKTDPKKNEKLIESFSVVVPNGKADSEALPDLLARNDDLRRTSTAVIVRQRVGAPRRPMTGSGGRSSIREKWCTCREAAAYWIPASAGMTSLCLV